MVLQNAHKKAASARYKASHPGAGGSEGGGRGRGRGGKVKPQPRARLNEAEFPELPGASAGDSSDEEEAQDGEGSAAESEDGDDEEGAPPKQPKPQQAAGKQPTPNNKDEEPTEEELEAIKFEQEQEAAELQAFIASQLSSTSATVTYSQKEVEDDPDDIAHEFAHLLRQKGQPAAKATAGWGTRAQVEELDEGTKREIEEARVARELKSRFTVPAPAKAKASISSGWEHQKEEDVDDFLNSL